MHVLCLGLRDPDEPPDVASANYVEAIIVQSASFQMRRIRTTRELFRELNAITNRGANKIETLDFFDHASSGSQRLGVSFIFARRLRFFLVGRVLAKKLRKYLTPNASIRLLGCDVADNSNGTWVLEKLARVFGDKRRVLGTTRKLNENAFGPAGLLSPHAADLVSKP